MKLIMGLPNLLNNTMGSTVHVVSDQLLIIIDFLSKLDNAPIQIDNLTAFTGNSGLESKRLT